MNRLPFWLDAAYKKIFTQYTPACFPAGLLLIAPVPLQEALLLNAILQTLLCEAEEPSRCKRCKSCALFEANTHPDAQLLTPETPMGVELMQETLAPLERTAHHGRRVIGILASETLTEAAMNRLLKAIEEPPPGCHFVLVATQPQRLLPTLQSRLHLYNLPALCETELLPWLEQRTPQRSDSERLTAIRVSAGSPVGALEALTEAACLQRQEWMEAVERAVERRALLLLLPYLDRSTLDPLRHYALVWLDGAKARLGLQASMAMPAVTSIQKLPPALLFKLWSTTLRCTQQLIEVSGLNQTLCVAALLQEQTSLLTHALRRA